MERGGENPLGLCKSPKVRRHPALAEVNELNLKGYSILNKGCRGSEAYTWETA